MPTPNAEFLDYAFQFFQSCQWCLHPLERKDATADHIRPVSRGGNESWRNKLISCKECNFKKKAKILVDRHGTWMHKHIPSPHGPRWFGPRRISRYLRKHPHYLQVSKHPPTDWWCKCHHPQENSSSGLEQDDPTDLLTFKRLIIFLMEQGQNTNSLGEALTFGLTWLRGGRSTKADALLDQDINEWYHKYKELTRENILLWAADVEIDSNIARPLMMKEVLGSVHPERVQAERRILDMILGPSSERETLDEEGTN